jgi:hypothetical protein
MTTEEISKILKLHKAWINGEKHGKTAYLSRADLSGAYLSMAYLSGANLSGANLSGADLSMAYLSGAYLSGADLSMAYLSGAYLSGAENVPYTPMACPDEGEFTGWKKCKSNRIVIVQKVASFTQLELMTLILCPPSTPNPCDLRQNGLKHRMKVQTEAGKLALAVHGNPDGQHQSTNIAPTVEQGW